MIVLTFILGVAFGAGGMWLYKELATLAVLEELRREAHE